MSTATQPLYNLQEVLRHFEEWRGDRRKGRGKIPQELWNEAVALTAHYPTKHVCQQLRLNQSSLNEHKRGLEGSSHKTSVNFVQVDVHSLSISPLRVQEVTFERPDGALMKVREESGFELSSLLNTFIGGSHVPSQSS